MGNNNLPIRQHITAVQGQDLDLFFAFTENDVPVDLSLLQDVAFSAKRLETDAEIFKFQLNTDSNIHYAGTGNNELVINIDEAAIDGLQRFNYSIELIFNSDFSVAYLAGEIVLLHPNDIRLISALEFSVNIINS